MGSEVFVLCRFCGWALSTPPSPNTLTLPQYVRGLEKLKEANGELKERNRYLEARMEHDRAAQKREERLLVGAVYEVCWCVNRVLLCCVEGSVLLCLPACLPSRVRVVSFGCH